MITIDAYVPHDESHDIARMQARENLKAHLIPARSIGVKINVHNEFIPNVYASDLLVVDGKEWAFVDQRNNYRGLVIGVNVSLFWKPNTDPFWQPKGIEDAFGRGYGVFIDRDMAKGCVTYQRQQRRGVGTEDVTQTASTFMLLLSNPNFVKGVSQKSLAAVQQAVTAVEGLAPVHVNSACSYWR